MGTPSALSMMSSSSHSRSGPLNFCRYHLLQYAVSDGRVELANVHFKAVPRPVGVFSQIAAQVAQQRMKTAPLYTSVGVGREASHPDRLKYLHYCPLHHAVAVWQFVDFTAFRLILDKDAIFRRVERLVYEVVSYALDIGHKVRLESDYLRAFALLPACIEMGFQQIGHRANLLKKITFSFHVVSALHSRELSRRRAVLLIPFLTFIFCREAWLLPYRCISLFAKYRGDE